MNLDSSITSNTTSSSLSTSSSPEFAHDAALSDAMIASHIHDDADFGSYDPMDQIRSEAAASPLVSSITPLSQLAKEYASSHSRYIEKINSLSTVYTSYRPVRRDGSCFYRSYLFGILEFAILNKADPLTQNVCHIFQISLDALCQRGFDRIAIEDFYEYTYEIVLWACTTASATVDELAQRMNDESLAPYITSYLRMLTSNHLKSNSERFSPYLFDTDSTMDAFCSSAVEPSDRDADHLQCLALSEVLQVKVRIEYIDLSEGNANHYDMPETIDGPPSVHLLYRPGHYDVLYKSQ